jgi:2-amino-4-hydroxy-6-hydroxymethyldihydropteridine diphosphokinase
VDGTAYIGLGSNLGHRVEFLRRALEELTRCGSRVGAVSRLYESPPLYVVDQPPFLNAAARLETPLDPREFLAQLARVESRLGRVRGRRFGPRTIDLDILLWGEDGSLIQTAPDLTIPHPRLLERAFALLPLADVAPHLVHPLCRRTVRELADEAPGRPDVVALDGDWSGLSG